MLVAMQYSSPAQPREPFSAPLSDGTFGGNNVPHGRTGVNNGRGARLRDPGRLSPQEILLFFTCELKQTQAPVYFLVDCILEDGGGFSMPGSLTPPAPAVPVPFLLLVPWSPHGGTLLPPC